MKPFPLILNYWVLIIRTQSHDNGYSYNYYRHLDQKLFKECKNIVHYLEVLSVTVPSTGS